MSLHPEQHLQIFIDITIIEGNDNNPVFEFPTYTTDISEYNAIAMTSVHASGDVIITVRATDADGINTAAGMVEYRISSGAMQFGVVMFAIPNPSVSRGCVV